eukprot:4727705-Pleurochrysis_carterae.AAC.2
MAATRAESGQRSTAAQHAALISEYTAARLHAAGAADSPALDAALRRVIDALVLDHTRVRRAHAATKKTMNGPHTAPTG